LWSWLVAGTEARAVGTVSSWLASEVLAVADVVAGLR
jgi:hypothetical protein